MTLLKKQTLFDIDQILDNADEIGIIESFALGQQLIEFAVRNGWDPEVTHTELGPLEFLIAKSFDEGVAHAKAKAKK
jgi:hypothetical protein